MNAFALGIFVLLSLVGSVFDLHPWLVLRKGMWVNAPTIRIAPFGEAGALSARRLVVPCRVGHFH